MKQSVVTGEYIFNQLKGLYDELKELGQACDTVADEIGQDSLAYRILNENYKTKNEELEKFKKQGYMVYNSVNVRI